MSGSEKHVDGSDALNPQRHGQGQRSDQRDGHVSRGQGCKNCGPGEIIFLGTFKEGICRSTSISNLHFLWRLF